MSDATATRDRRVSRGDAGTQELARRPSSRERAASRENSATEAVSRRPSTRERPSSRDRPSSRVGSATSEPLSGTGVSVASDADNQGVPSCPGRLGNYDVQKAVGKGGYAVVYKAVRKDDGKVVAVKRVEIFEMAPKKRERCLQEVHLLQQLTHPNIIQMLDAFIDENQLIIIFEWAPGGDLKRHIKKAAEVGKGFDEPTVWSYFFQVVDALRYMHTNRIMHRDIKPANVLLGANGTLKLADLGLGRQFSEQTLEAFSKVGTPYYVSPEVVRGEGYDWKSDVWSLGCLLYELVMLRSPFEMEGANLYDVFQKITKCEYAALPADTCSTTLRSLVGKLLQTDTARRPELEEVWAVARAVVETQSTTRVDIHSLSERLVAGIAVLAAQNSAASSSGRAVAEPPGKVLRSIHPLFFAEPMYRAGPQAEGEDPVYRGGGPQAEELHKAQLGTMVAVLAWLLRLNGKEEAAEKLDAELDPKAKSLKGASPWIAALPRVKAVLKGAEMAKKAVQALGVSTEFAAAAQLSTGHGRAVCSVLSEAVDITAKRLGMTMPPPKYPVQDEEDGVEDADDGDGQLVGDDETVGTGNLPHGSTTSEDLQGYFLSSEAFERARAAVEASTSSHTASIMHSEVDPVKWRAELERVAPKLKQIRLKGGAHAYADWLSRWQTLGELDGKFKTGGKTLLPVLDTYGKQVSSVLERLQSREQKVNENHHLNLGILKAKNVMLQQLQTRHQEREDAMQKRSNVLSELHFHMQEVQGKIEERTGSLDGAKVVAQMSEAIVKLKREVKDMDIRTAVLWSQLTRRQTQHMSQQLEMLANARGQQSW